MRRLSGILTIFACAAGLAAGCGGDDGAGGPLESSLAYVPKGTPFVVAIDTDIEGDQYKSVQGLLDRFPGGYKLESLLAGQVDSGEAGLSYEKDVKPLLGNPFVISATDVTTFVDDSEDDDFVASIQVNDKEALDRVIEKTKAAEQGEVAGATLYEDDGTVFAVEDDIVVFAGTRKLLDGALERADGDDHLDPAAFEDSLEGLPEQALARIYFDVQALVASDPDTAPARKIKWVSALSTLGMTAAVEDDRMDIDFNLRSDAEELSDEDLPLAAGDEAPEVVQEPGEIGFGLRDPSQIVTFVESSLQAVDPGTYGDYQTGKQAISQQLDVDLDKDVFDQLTGDMSVTVALDGSFGARAAVQDPDAFGRTLDKIAEALPDIGSGLGVTGVRQAGDLYEAQLEGGGRFFFGMGNDALVVASEAARARALASQEPSAVQDAEGSFVMTADAEQLMGRLLAQLGPALGLPSVANGLISRPFDQLSGSVTTSTDAMRGKISLTLD